MIPALLHHTNASHAVRIAQFAAVGLTAAAAAVLTFGPSARERPVAALTLPNPAPKPAPVGAEKPVAHADAHGISLAMSQLGNSPKPEPKSAPTPTDAAPTPVVSEESVRYLGSLTEPGRRLALLKINDHQRLLAPGERIEAIHIVEVGPDYAVIEDSKGQRKLTKGERQGSAVTYTAANTLGAAPSTFNPGSASIVAEAARNAKFSRDHVARAAQKLGEVVNTSVNVSGTIERLTGDQQP